MKPSPRVIIWRRLTIIGFYETTGLPDLAIEFGLPYHPVAFVENFTTFLRDNPPVVAPIVTGAQANFLAWGK